jgi:hypothetical protein
MKDWKSIKSFENTEALIIKESLLIPDAGRRLSGEKTVQAQASGLKNTQLLSQRGKSCSVSGFALLSLLERNHARSAFKRFFYPLAFA